MHLLVLCHVLVLYCTLVECCFATYRTPYTTTTYLLRSFSTYSLQLPCRTIIQYDCLFKVPVKFPLLCFVPHSRYCPGVSALLLSQYWRSCGALESVVWTFLCIVRYFYFSKDAYCTTATVGCLRIPSVCTRLRARTVHLILGRRITTDNGGDADILFLSYCIFYIRHH